MGMLTAVGLDRDSSWQALQAGTNGITPLANVDTEGFKVTFGGEIKDFDPTVVMDAKEARKADRFAQLAVVAADEAVRQANLGDDFDPTRAGVIIGSGIGGMLTFEEQHSRLINRGPRGVSPMFIPMMIGDMAAGLVSIRHGFRGANYCTVSACASGGHAIGAAYDQIILGHNDVMVTGGAEAAICSMALAGFANMKALSTRNDDPATASRPFDKGRDGFVLGEGAGILVLEAEEHAQARGATILGELAGYGMSGDAYHMTQPDTEGKGAIASMQQALRAADAASAGCGLHQRPRHIDLLQRHDREQGHQRGLRRLRLQVGHQLDQVHDGTPARRRRCRRGRDHDLGAQRRPPAADNQSGDAGSRMRL